VQWSHHARRGGCVCTGGGEAAWRKIRYRYPIRIWRPGSEIARFAEEIPTVDCFSSSTNVITGIHGAPGLSAIQAHDRNELPSFQELTGKFSSGDAVGEGKSETMANVKVTAGILTAGMRGVLRKAQARAEVPVRTHIVERVGIGIACCRREPMIIS